MVEGLSCYLKKKLENSASENSLTPISYAYRLQNHILRYQNEISHEDFNYALWRKSRHKQTDTISNTPSLAHTQEIWRILMKITITSNQSNNTLSSELEDFKSYFVQSSSKNGFVWFFLCGLTWKLFCPASKQMGFYNCHCCKFSHRMGGGFVILITFFLLLSFSQQPPTVRHCSCKAESILVRMHKTESCRVNTAKEPSSSTQIHIHQASSWHSLSCYSPHSYEVGGRVSASSTRAWFRC